MSFIQLFEMKTKDVDAVTALTEEWEAATEGRRTARRSVVGRDRNDPDRHVVIVFFDSYESAMENSNLPETQEMATKMQALLDGPPVFTDLDVIEDRER